MVSAVRATLEAAWTPAEPHGLVNRRRDLQTDLASLRAVHADALADAGDDPAADERWPVSAAVEELAVLALSFPPHRRPPDPQHARDFLDHLDVLRTAIAVGVPPPLACPEVAGYPRTSAAAAALTDAATAAARVVD